MLPLIGRGVGVPIVTWHGSNQMAFNLRKAAQIVAFFARERGGAIDVIDAVKLVYLGDREFMDRFGFTISDDVFYALREGPICSSTYDFIKGRGTPDERRTWEGFVSPRVGNLLKVAKKFEDDDFDELSDAELEILYVVAHKFARFKPFELVRWVHENCTEWKNPGSTSIYLSYADVFRALGKKESKRLENRLVETRKLKRELLKAQ